MTNHRCNHFHWMASPAVPKFASSSLSTLGGGAYTSEHVAFSFGILDMHYRLLFHASPLHLQQCHKHSSRIATVLPCEFLPPLFVPHLVPWTSYSSHCEAQPWECNESQCDLYYQATVLVRLPLIWASASLIGTELVLPEMACSSGIVCWHQRRKMSLPWLWRTRNMKYTERSRGEETLMYIISLSGPFPTDSNHMSSYMTVKRDRNVENRLRRCSGIRHGISALLGSHTWSNTSFGSANRYMGRYLWKLLNDTAMTLFQTATFGDPSEMLRTCQFDGTKAQHW